MQKPLPAGSEQTLVLIKPDGLTKSLTGNILTRLSETKLEIAAAKVLRVSRELAEAHYKALREKPFFEELIQYIMGEFHPRKKVLSQKNLPFSNFYHTSGRQSMEQPKMSL